MTSILVVDTSERVLDALATAAQRLRNGEGSTPDIFVQAVDFIRNFADGCHHAKEDDVLSKAMLAAGMPPAVSPVTVMRVDHDQAREYTTGMIDAAERPKQADQRAADELIAAAPGYVAQAAR